MDVPADLVALGVVRGAFGVKGWVRIQPFGAETTLQSTRLWWLQQPDGQAKRLAVTEVKPHSGALLAKWDGCESPELADTLKGATIAVPRSAFPALPEGEVYWVDLIGARVINRNGTELGTVTALSSNGAQDLLEVTGESGTLLVPMVPSYVESVDVAAREVRVDWEADW
jgi:16S rRNA processing protein RimM